MKDVIEFLEKNRNGYLATIDGNQARVRVFQFQFEEDGKFFFITSNKKSVWKQLQDNPKVEFCVMSKDMFPYIRITGKIGFSGERQHKERGFQLSPLVTSVFGSVDNPDVETVYIEQGRAVLTKTPAGESEIFDF